MIGRLISFSGADPARRDEAVETIRGTVIPMLRNFDGYGGYIALYDGEGGRAKALVLWESKEAADASEAELETRRRHISSTVGLTVDSVELYEVPVFELEGAATRV